MTRSDYRFNKFSHQIYLKELGFQRRKKQYLSNSAQKISTISLIDKCLKNRPYGSILISRK